LLARQIEDGAPVDVLVSAGWSEVERLRAKDLVVGEPIVIARNRLVVLVPASSPWIGKEPLALLGSMALARLAIGDPATVPVGAYARTALRRAGLWDALEARVVYAGEVRQALTYADQGSVDAAIVYVTDARLAKTAVLLGDVPGAAGLAIETVAVRTSHRATHVALAFLRHLEGPGARRVLLGAGFLEPR
jgi:molybdate transport system substrate-binding protein